MSRALPPQRALHLLLSAWVTVAALLLSSHPAAGHPNAAVALVEARAAHLWQHSSAPAWPVDALPGRLLVTTEGGPATWQGLRSVLSRHARGHAGYHLTAVHDDALLVHVPPGNESSAAAALLTIPGVVAVEPDRLRTLSSRPNDPGFPAQWSHRLTGAPDAWRISVGGPSVRVAVIDSGIRGDHEDLRANVVEQVDASSGRVIPAASGIDNDTCGLGHGTQVAGVLAGVGNNELGITGMAWQASVIDVAVVSQAAGTCDLGAPDSAILAGMYYVLSHPDGPVDVINLSLGGPQDACPTAYRRAITAAREAGTVVVAAAGNTSRDGGPASAPSVPASCDGVLSVGAVGRHLQHAPYSRANAWVDLSAPGGEAPQGCAITPEECLLTTTHDGGYGAVQGTSFAAPQVAGAVALLRAVRPSLTPADIESLLVHSAVDLGPTGHDGAYGWGLLRVREALQSATADPPSFEPVLEVPFPETGPALTRVWTGDPVTDPVEQALAVSQELFADGGARHAVIVGTSDPLAALVASPLGLGMGPLLFATPEGVSPAALNELGRVLRPGARVYVVGGSDAVPARAEAQLRARGFDPRRIAGANPPATAALVSQELPLLLKALGLRAVPWAVLAGTSAWVDAAAAASLAATFGVPVLLTSPDELHPDAAAALSQHRPQRLLVVGGTASLSADTVAAAAAAAGDPQVVRFAGDNRNDTALRVGQGVIDLLADETGRAPAVAVMANVRQDEAWAHLLSASSLAAARTGIVVPVEGEGNVLAPSTVAFLTGLGLDVLVIGGPDLVAGEVAQTAQELAGRR